MDSNTIIQNIVRFVLLILAQLLILNNVNLSGFAIPYLYILFILMLPTNTGRIAMLLCAFAAGLTIDIFSNMLGFHTFACVIVAFARILFADRILTRNQDITISKPSIHSVKPQYFVGYTVVLTGLFNFVYFAIELFDNHGFWKLIAITLLSTLLTSALIVLTQLVFTKKERV